MDNKNELSNSMTLLENSTFITPKHTSSNHKVKKWKPSELESTVLKMHFRSNQFPTNDEKEAIIKTLDVEFHSQVKSVQLTRWFKNERERICAKNTKEAPKHRYQKFEKEELDYLTHSFSEDNYPKLAVMTEMAKQMRCSLSKIENWYKHNRRVMAKQGCLKLKTKKYFKKDELNYLIALFIINSCPNRIQMQEIAEKLNCDAYQIKNWYSNRRKKFRLSDTKNNNFQTIDPMLENQDDTSSLLSPETQTDSKISQGPNIASQFYNLNTPLLQSSPFLNDTAPLQDMSKLYMNIRPNTHDIFSRNTAYQEMIMINQTANLNQILPTTHSKSHLPYPNSNSLDNPHMALQNKTFWPQAQQNIYPNNFTSPCPIHPSIISNQTNQVINGERLQPQLISIQSWPNMSVPCHNRLQDVTFNGPLMNLTQFNRPLNVMMNPIQFVVVVDPNQQYLRNHTLIYP